MFVLKNHPQPFNKLVEDLFRLFAYSFFKVAPLACLNIAIAVIPSAIHFAFLYFSSEDGVDLDRETFGLGILMGMLLMPALMSSVLFRVQSVAEARPVGNAMAFRRSVACSVQVIIGTVLFFLAVGLGTVLLILPGIFLFCGLIFAWAGIVLDKQGPITALRISLRLVRSNWWRTFIVICAAYGLSIGIMGLMNAALSPIPEVYFESAPALCAVVLLAFLSFSIFPVALSSALVVQYNDLKLRKQSGM